MSSPARLPTVAEARNLILSFARPLPPQTLPLDPSVLGLVLAEDVAADLDSPPHDKALMDGYAVRSADLAAGSATLTVTEEVTAGQVPTLPVGPGLAARIMTGAPLPAGADAVVMVERSEPLADGRVRLADRPPRPGQHVLPRGREMRRGEVVLKAGTVLRPQDVGLLAALGRAQVRAVPPPRVHVLVTGDELVEAPGVPGPGQIRNSNGPMLLAQVSRGGGRPRYLGIARDRRDSLEPLIDQGLAAPVLILSGGVSMGTRDLVPQVLAERGVRPVLHKVEMKPGKPLFFGVADRAEGPTLVFGLPGNPVSSFVGFELFMRPVLRRLAGHADPGPRQVTAALAEDFAYRSDRPTYHPARVEVADGWRVRPVPWFGSPDLRGLGPANALLLLPAGDGPHRVGQAFPVVCLDPM
jgi:molybdopterin molybdotransferase